MKNLFSKLQEIGWDIAFWVFETKLGQFLFIQMFAFIIIGLMSFLIKDVHNSFWTIFITFGLMNYIFEVFDDTNDRWI